MDLKNLNTFVTVAELKSFTRAADQLGYSQSTVSSQIKLLEDELGTPLFDRINRTVSLTERGADILPMAQQMLRMEDELKQLAKPVKGSTISGHVRIAMAASLCERFLRERYPYIREKYPEITLKIFSSDADEMRNLLSHNEADLVYTMEDFTLDPEYVIDCSESIGMHLVAAPQYAPADGKHLTLTEIIEKPLLLTEKGMSYRNLLDERLAALSLKSSPILEIGSPDLLCKMAAEGIGIAFLPDFTTDTFIASGALRYLEVEGFEPSIPCQLVHHRGKWISAPIAAVIEALKEKK